MAITTGKACDTLLIAAAVFLVTACQKDTAAPAAVTYADSVPAVTIMTFNVQNLFDNVDDPGKDDKAYLPIEAKRNSAHIAACNEIEVKPWRDECLYLDWSDAAIAHKLESVAVAIRQVNDGRGPDIIAFQEVENANILDQLSFDYLREANYGPAILIEGRDARGIDVAFLSRFPLTEPPKLQRTSFDDFGERRRDTRGVLQATFLLPDGSLLTGFSVHFPQPRHPTSMRNVAYEHLNALRDALPDNHHVFAAGDFNTTSTEDRAEQMFERHARRQGWLVAHDYCDGCRGTYFYRPDDNWSFLDTILFSPARGEKTTWKLRTDSVRVVNEHPYQVTPSGTPRRYDAERRRGVSDHWPLLVAIESTTKQ